MLAVYDQFNQRRANFELVRSPTLLTETPSTSLAHTSLHEGTSHPTQLIFPLSPEDQWPQASPDAFSTPPPSDGKGRSPWNIAGDRVWIAQIAIQEGDLIPDLFLAAGRVNNSEDPTENLVSNHDGN